MGKYERELEKELNPSNQPKKVTSYSQEYKQFLSEQTSSSKNFYTKACKFSAKIFPIPISEKDSKKINTYIDLLHLSITSQSVISFAYLATLLTIISSVILTVVTSNFYLAIIGLIAGLVMLFVLSKTPEFMFKSWRSKASDQLVSAVLYMVIYLEHTSNLEQAVYFAAKNLPPPLSLDFIRALWRVESGKYSKITDALEEYVSIWGEWNQGFVESIHLLESSLHTTTETHRHEILERTINTVLDSSEHNMMKYAHDSQNPVQAVHMLGIILPVMGLVMLPMVVSFMGDKVSIWQVIGLYNILLPLTVFLISKHTLDNRPSGVNTSDIYDFYAKKKHKAKIKIGNFVIHIQPIVAMFIVLAAFTILPVLYFIGIYSSDIVNKLPVLNNLLSLFMSLMLILGIAFSLGTYFRLRSHGLLKRQEELNKLDKLFSNTVFQLGNRLESGEPIEIAIKKVADAIPKSPVSEFFNNIYSNMIKNQTTLELAIFDKNFGAISDINSSLIRGVMRIIVQGSKKGSKIVSFSLITISRFLTSVRRVNERMKDLLAETIASLQSEVSFLIPIILGIVVAMAVLTTNILITLSVQLSELGGLTGGENGELGFGATLMNIFKLDYLIPSWIFQVVVGVYLIQVTLIISYLLAGIENGPQTVERDKLMQQNLFISSVVYTFVTLVMSGVFVLITAGLGGM